VTLCLFRFAFPLEQELLGRKVVQGLVRSHAVVDLLPVSKLVVQRGQAWFLVGQFVEFLVMRAIRALHMAVQFWGPWRQHEQGNLFLLAGLLELCGDSLPPSTWKAAIGKGIRSVSTSRKRAAASEVAR